MNSKKASFAIDLDLKASTPLNKQWLTWFSEFQKAFDLASHNIEESSFSSKSLLDNLTTSKVPHIFFFHKNEAKRSELREVFSSLRTLDPAVGIIVLTEGPATGRDTMSWLDLGATALISFDAQTKHLSEALRELFESRILNHIVRHPRIPAKHKIIMQLASLEQAIVAETLNIGVGGMFLRTLPPDIKTGDAVDFEFQFSQTVSNSNYPSTWNENTALQKMENTFSGPTPAGKMQSFTGKGTVVWVRTTSQKTEPEGIGIQYTELETSTQNYLMNFIKTHGLRSFIPKQ
jgi:hypothetical protein